MKNILLPISFSETSKNALYYANLIAKEYGATLSLVHCYSGYGYNREYNFGTVAYDEGIKQMLIDFYKKNIEKIDQQAFRVFAHEGSVADYISEISHTYELLVFSKGTGNLSKSKMWFGDKLLYMITKSRCPILLLPSKRIVFSFLDLKKIWHIQRKDMEIDLIKQQLVQFKIDSNLVISKSLQQEKFTSAFWQNIVKYTKTKDTTELKKIHEVYANEHLDLLILVNHRTGMFEKFLKDHTFQIIGQFDIPILVLQSK